MATEASYFTLVFAFVAIVISNLGDASSIFRRRNHTKLGSEGSEQKNWLQVWKPVLLMAVGVIVFWGQYQFISEATRRVHLSVEPAVTARKYQEASGATTAGGFVYAVDDESRKLLRFVADPNGRLFLKTSIAIEPDETPLYDLEGLAVDPGDPKILFAIGSQSSRKQSDSAKSGVFPSKDPKDIRRRGFAEICIDGDRPARVNRVFDVFPALVAKLTEQRVPLQRFAAREEEGDEEILVGMEIEGLAVDARRHAYIGLRAPLDGSAALIFELTLPPAIGCSGQATQAVTLDARDLRMHQVYLNAPSGEEKDLYGIVSLEFDPADNDFFILANSPAPYLKLPPLACKWRPGRATPHCVVLTQADKPYNGKMEALALLPNGKAAILIDGDGGLGGSVAYPRKDLPQLR